MKKIISLLIVTAMLVTGLVAVVPGTAADLPETDLYTQLTGEVSENRDTLTVRVSLGNNPGLWGYRVFVSYNAAALKLTSIENTENVWTNSQYTPGNINANPTTYYAQMEAYNENNEKNGVVAVYTFQILDTEASFNVNLTFDAIDVFGVNEKGDATFYDMLVINECPQYIPIDTTALDAMAAEIMSLPAYDELQGEQIDKMLSLYNSVHELEGRSEAYFTETYADAIAKIDGLYADHQWALVKVELDALGARVNALPVYAEMTEAQVEEMLALRTELASLEGQEKEYVETTYADAVARLAASYDAFLHEGGLNALGARIEALPAFEAMSEAQIQEMLALTEELSALSAEDQTYIATIFADAYARLQASQTAYQHVEELKAVGAEIEALPVYAEMTEVQVEEMLALIAMLETMPAEDVAYISNNYGDAYTRLNDSYARYQRILELDALVQRMNALPDDFYDMTEDQVAEMLELIEIMNAIEDAEDQQYLSENYIDALMELATNYALYLMEEEVKDLKARIEALPNYEDITEDYLEEVVSIAEAIAGTMIAQRFQEEIPQAYENFVNAYFKLVYGGTESVDMEKVNAFVEAVGELTAEQKEEVLDLMYSLYMMETEDSITADYIYMNYPGPVTSLVEMYIAILENEEIDYVLLAELEEKILALPAYENMTEADKAAFSDIIDAISGLSAMEMFSFKIGYVEAYETYLTLYAAYEADAGSEEPPVTTDTTAPGGEDTTASANVGGGDKKPPQTGDNMMYIVIVAAIATVACTAVCVIRRKKESVK